MYHLTCVGTISVHMHRWNTEDESLVPPCIRVTDNDLMFMFRSKYFVRGLL